jgi:hypothetical protein
MSHPLMRAVQKILMVSLLTMAGCTFVQFLFNETKLMKQVSRFRFWDSHFENPVVAVCPIDFLHGYGNRLIVAGKEIHI